VIKRGRGKGGGMLINAAPGRKDANHKEKKKKAEGEEGKKGEGLLRKRTRAVWRKGDDHT